MTQTNNIVSLPQALRDIKNTSAPHFYFTSRYNLNMQVNKDEHIKKEYIYMLYNNLTYKFKEISKKKLGEAEGNDIYEYIISTRPYNSDEDATYAFAGYSLDKNISKKKYLIVSGMDGNEHKAVLSVYKFAYDLLHGYNIPNDFKEGVEIHIIPIANP